MSENVFNHGQALKQIEAESKGYDINQHANETIGPVDVKQVMASMQPITQQMEQGGAQQSFTPEQPSIRQSTGERTSDPSFGKYEYAWKQIEGKNNFSFNGKNYFKHGGKTYEVTNAVPNIGKAVDPTESVKMDIARAEQTTPDYERAKYLEKRKV